MKTRVSRRKFIASAAVSMVPSALAYAQPKSGGLLSFFAEGQQPSKSPTNWKDAGVIDLSNSPLCQVEDRAGESGGDSKTDSGRSGARRI